MARIDDEIQNTRQGVGELLDAWEKMRGAERWLRFNGLITGDTNSKPVPTDLFTADKFQGTNAESTPQQVCDALDAMNRAEVALTAAGFAPFYKLRS